MLTEDLVLNQSQLIEYTSSFLYRQSTTEPTLKAIFETSPCFIPCAYLLLVADSLHDTFFFVPSEDIYKYI